MPSPCLRRTTWHPRTLLLAALPLLAAGTAAAATHAPLCTGGATRLCLGGRYSVEVTWRDSGGRDHAAIAVPLQGARVGAFSWAGDDADLLVGVAPAAAAGASPLVVTGSTAAAFELLVVDTRTGERFRRWSPAGALLGGDRAAGPPASETTRPDRGSSLVALLEAAERAPARPREDAALRLEGCVPGATTLCFLDGRLRVRAESRGGADRRSALATAIGERSGIFAGHDGPDADVAVRVVDGRAVNGHFWLLYGSLGNEEVDLELTDMASGNRRIFHAETGRAAGTAAVEALSASAAVVRVSVDTARAVRKDLGAAGGFVEAVDGLGTRFRLVLPAGALPSSLTVTLTPVTAIDGLPFAGGLGGAVRIEPEGLILAQSGLLTITPAAAVAPSQQISFAFRGLHGELALAPPLARQTALVLPVHRLGGYGVAGGTAAELAAQLGRAPSRAEDRFAQQLAGLVLPARRAANGAAAMPATVSSFLQADYVARVRPVLAGMRLGALDATFPVTRTWRNAARDASLDGTLAAPIKELTAAEIAGAKKSYEIAGKSDSKAGSARCASVTAAGRMFRAFAVLRAHGAQRQVKEDALLRCARFELHFVTELTSLTGSGVTAHDEVVIARLPILLDVARGIFLGGVPAPQTVATASVRSPCSIVQQGRKVQTSLKVSQLHVPLFVWHESLLPDGGDDLASTSPEIAYDYDPPSSVGWHLHCPEQHPAPGIVLPGIDTQVDTTWTGTYTFFHADEKLAGPRGGFRIGLHSSHDPRIYGEMRYDRNPYGSELFAEITDIFLLFTPQ